ncbi:methyltransferase [Arthrobacter sp. ISL-30]|uniref:class I SAM-dependent methyltransferase n=1 Tax=Arthrobacter sp. ISL-30 TaxID=2819109 RepID=UPI001BE88FCC|nr:methyltransferase [Arthrobacter sp. ISL-30]MBT2513558.1 methyltransferase [Arthrobacter sp. ISL-30]
MPRLDTHPLDLDGLFGRLRRFPDVEAANLEAHDATDRLLLETAAGLGLSADSQVAVVGDRYGALTLGSLVGLGVGRVRVFQDLYSGRLALARNASAAGLAGRFEHHELGESLLSGADLVLLQLPKSLAELDEVGDAVARYIRPSAVLLAGGRVKHMSLGMNEVLARYFGTVQPQLAQRKSRVLLASMPQVPVAAPPFPVSQDNSELGLTVCSHGAVFAGTRLDIGTRFLLEFIDRMPAVAEAVDLGCGTGILATMYARSHQGSRITATDQSAAAVASARATAAANGLADRIRVVHDDAMSTFAAGSAKLILLNPPFHLGASVHAGAALRMFEAAARVLASDGELWTVYNNHLQYLPALERLVGPSKIEGRNPKFTVVRSRRR